MDGGVGRPFGDAFVGCPAGTDGGLAVGNLGFKHYVAECWSQFADVVGAVEDMQSVGVLLQGTMIEANVVGIETSENGVVVQTGVAGADMVTQGGAVGRGVPT